MTEDLRVTIELTKEQAHRLCDLIRFVFDENGGASSECEELLNNVLVDNFVKCFGDEFSKYMWSN